VPPSDALRSPRPTAGNRSHGAPAIRRGGPKCGCGTRPLQHVGDRENLPANENQAALASWFHTSSLFPAGRLPAPSTTEPQRTIGCSRKHSLKAKPVSGPTHQENRPRLLATRLRGRSCHDRIESSTSKCPKRRTLRFDERPRGPRPLPRYRASNRLPTFSCQPHPSPGFRP
jgi:hypothetical protein